MSPIIRSGLVEHVTLTFACAHGENPHGLVFGGKFVLLNSNLFSVFPILLVRHLGPHYMSRAARLTGLLRCAEITFRSVLLEASQLG